MFIIYSLYDEDGYGAVKRVVERGEDVASVKPMATIVVNYPVIFYVNRLKMDTHLKLYCPTV